MEVIMQRNTLGKFNSYVILILIIFISITLPDVIAGGKAGVYVIYMVPRGDDANNYSQSRYKSLTHAVLLVSTENTPTSPKCCINPTRKPFA